MATAALRQIFLDTETTGLSADNGDRVIELGCIEMVNRRLTGNTLHLYFNPERSSHPDAVRVHGITDEFLADKPRFVDCADEVTAFLGGAEIIIHNASFDVGFLNAELRRAERPLVAQTVAQVTDTLLMAREMYPGKSNSLDALCKRLEVDTSQRSFHGALLDAGLLAQVYICLTRGQDSLAVDAQDGHLAQDGTAESVDLSRFDLPLLQPTPEEAAAHVAMLQDLDKASKGKTLWRSLQPMA